MGAAVGVEVSAMPDDILQLFKECEAEQAKIVETDNKFLQSQSRQMWKNHKKIIATVCSKTKNQLSRMAAAGGPGVGLATQLCDMLGGAYGDFVRNLVLSKSTIDSEAMRAALDSIGCDEDALVSFLCVSSPDEISSLLEVYNEAAAVDLAAKIHGKIEKDSPFQVFIQCLLAGKRDGDATVDPDSVLAQAADIKAICEVAGSDRNKELFELLCRVSRAQCSLINIELLQSNQVTLDSLFKKKFSGNMYNALSLWSSPKDNAVCQAFYDVLHDPSEEYDRLSSIVSKYDKLQLKSIQTNYESLFSESLVSRIESVTVGNHKLALVAWIGAPAFDGMNEETIVNIISSHGSLAAALSKDENAIREALKKEKEALVEHNKNAPESDAGIPEAIHRTLPPISAPKRETTDDVAEVARISSKIVDALDEKVEQKARSETKDENVTEQAEQKDATVNVAARPDPVVIDTKEPTLSGQGGNGSPTKVVPLSAHSKKAVSIRGLAVDFDAKFKAVSTFLKEQFAAFDTDKSGYLETAEFWNAIRSFKLGYTDEEIGAMAEWTDWDCDGNISLSEVINELAESVITMIEGQGEELLTGLEAIRSRLKKENEELKRLESDGGLSVDLVGYLKDSFEAYDTDENGSLGTDEFWKVINVVLCETVNGLKDIELEEMRVMFCYPSFALTYLTSVLILQKKWDSNNDGWITWKEALTQFVDILNGMISDKRDHWVRNRWWLLF